MAPETQTSRREEQVTTTDLGHGARVIALRGAIRGGAVDELRDRLLAAIDAGAREVVVDLTDVESLGSPVHDLVPRRASPSRIAVACSSCGAAGMPSASRPT